MAHETTSHDKQGLHRQTTLELGVSIHLFWRTRQGGVSDENSNRAHSLDLKKKKRERVQQTIVELQRKPVSLFEHCVCF